MSERARPSTTPRRRPRRIPPPIRSSGEPFEAARILEEFSGDRALLLWKTARSVELWADLSEAERREAFGPGAYRARMRLLREVEGEAGEGEGELAERLAAAAEILGRPADPRAVAEACRAVSRWARERGAIRTALQFMQAAALVAPDDAETALEVGRLAREDRDLGRAESWFRQAVFSARRTRDWQSYGVAHLALAIVLKERGNYPAARRTAVRALRAARRHSLREVEGRAHHDLMDVAIATHAERPVVEHARGALEAYGPRHPRLPSLAHDLAYFWMESGYFPAALRVFRSLRGSLEPPRERLYLHANLARAAAGAGEAEDFEAAWAEAHRLMEDPQAAAGTGAALLDLAHGALSLGRRERAREAAERALDLAREQGLGRVSLEAEALLAAAAGEGAAEAVRPRPARAEPEPVGSLAEALAAAL